MSPYSYFSISSKRSEIICARNGLWCPEKCPEISNFFLSWKWKFRVPRPENGYNSINRANVWNHNSVSISPTNTAWLIVCWSTWVYVRSCLLWQSVFAYFRATVSWFCWVLFSHVTWRPGSKGVIAGLVADCDACWLVAGPCSIDKQFSSHWVLYRGLVYTI